MTNPTPISELAPLAPVAVQELMNGAARMGHFLGSTIQAGTIPEEALAAMRTPDGFLVPVAGGMRVWLDSVTGIISIWLGPEADPHQTFMLEVPCPNPPQ